ncbi:MAG: hypothetical protein CMI26_00700 [Opitutae bacterium]|nr:hypothetical protein [Opitutae bacterium]|tara:strand:- start:1822 stop:3870 length:2049 start_codon:yes stop_codon:yes gene_type:complete
MFIKMKVLPSLSCLAPLVALLAFAPKARSVPPPFNPSPQKTAIMREAVNRINLSIEQKLAEKKIPYNESLNDFLFVRRIYVDLSGTIPTYEQVTSFVRSRDPYKRTRLINQLLASEGYVSHFYNYLADLFRIQSQMPGSNLRSDPFIAWLKDSIHQDKPYNRIVYEMISASGRLHDNPAVGYHLRDVDMKLDHVSFMSQIFLAKDISCAQCHDHPFEEWTQMDYYSLASFLGGLETKGKAISSDQKKKSKKPTPTRSGAVIDTMQEFLKSRKFEQAIAKKENLSFTRDKEKVKAKAKQLRDAFDRLMDDNRYNVHDKPDAVMKLPDDYQYDDAKPGEEVKPRVLVGAEPKFPRNLNNREQLARWIASPNNQWFALTIANRMWARFFGLGAAEPIHNVEVDDASNPVLLKTITEVMIALEFDLRAFSWVLAHTNSYNRLATRKLVTEKDDYYFPGPTLRRMTAEQVWDSFVTLLVENPLRYRSAGGITLQDITNAESAITFAESLTASTRTGKKRSQGQFLLLDSQTGETVLQGDKDMGSSSGDPSAQRVTSGRGKEKLILARASELEQPTPQGHFLRKFGQSERTYVVGASNLSGSVPQIMELMNGFATEALINQDSLIFRKMKEERSPSKRAEIVFLSVLNRLANPAEQKLLRNTLLKNDEEDMADLIWALLNTPEFFFIK